MKNKRHNYSDGWSPMEKKLMIGALVLGCAGLAGYCILSDRQEKKRKSEFENVLVKYGDSNRDGIINKYEEMRLFREITGDGDKNVVYVYNERIIASERDSGKRLSNKKVRELIKDYNDKISGGIVK